MLDRLRPTRKGYRYRLIDGTTGVLDLSTLPQPKVEGDLQELEELVEALFAARFPDEEIRVYIGNPFYRGSWIVGYWDGDRYEEI